MQVLKQCDGDLSRENVMRQATNLHDLVLPTLLPGIKINTSPTNYRPMRALQLMKWDGKTWARFGECDRGCADLSVGLWPTLHHFQAFNRQDCIEIFDALPLLDHHGITTSFRESVRRRAA